MAIDEEAALDLVQDGVLERLGNVSLEEIEGVGVHSADEHLGEADYGAKFLFGQRDYPVLELRSGLLREREGHDLAWRHPATEQVDDPFRDHLGFP